MTQNGPREAAREVLAPRAEKLVRLLDDLVRVPGTRIGIGLDAIVGFVLPGAGDFITGTGSMALLYLALKHRVPKVVVGRMLLNIATDAVLGAVPFVGDAFDLFFRSNRRNLALVEKYRDSPDAKPSPLDYVLVGAGGLLAVASVALPLLLLYALFGAGVFAAARLFESCAG